MDEFGGLADWAQSGHLSSTSFFFNLFFKFLLICFLALLPGMSDLSSLTRDQTCAPCRGSKES